MANRRWRPRGHQRSRSPRRPTSQIADVQSRRDPLLTILRPASRSLVETFVVTQAAAFRIAQGAIAERRHAANTSIIPSGLIDHLTDAKRSDLFADLGTGKFVER